LQTLIPDKRLLDRVQFAGILAQSLDCRDLLAFEIGRKNTA